MRSWTRWQDWVALVAGAYLALSPLWTTVPNGGRWTMIILGVLLFLSALWSLAQPGAVASEWVHAALGVLAFIAPWVVSYSTDRGAAWGSWVVGVVAFVVGIWALPASQADHRLHAISH